MSDVTKVHEERETLTVDVEIPGHAARTTTPLFTKSRKALLEREGHWGCFICGMPHSPQAPLEAHHYPIERCLAEMMDWSFIKAEALRGELGGTGKQRAAAQAFDWIAFDPADPYSFVDNMLVNGLLLCKSHHIGKDEGIHAMPHPLWIAQRYAQEGYEFSTVEIIHHHDPAGGDGNG
jgi:hypothetical protein